MGACRYIDTFCPYSHQRPARRTPTGPATAQAAEFAYTYDLGGNRLSEQTDATVRAWQPNSRNQIETESPGGAISVRETEMGRLKRLKWGRAKTEMGSCRYIDTFCPYSHQRPARRTPTGPATAQAAEFAYTYDLSGNRLSEQTDATVRARQPNSRNQIETESPGGAISVRAQFNAATDGDRAFVNGREVLLDSAHRIDTLAAVQSGNNTLTVRAQDATTGGVLRKSWQVSVPAFL